MVNQKFYQLGTAPSVIRELFAYGLEQAQVVGPENVFDYSLGNPSIPAPAKVNQSIHDILNDTDSIRVHGYSMACGFDAAREAIAANLNRRFGMELKPGNLFLTCGAAPGLIAVIKALLAEEDSEIMAVAPFFPEYRPFTESNGGRLVVVPADTRAFQIDLSQVERRITPRTQAIIINSPNNPSGVVYTRQTLEGLARLLERKGAEYGHPIYIIADEPYRELVYGGVEVPFIPTVYRNTIVCYSYSKSLSLPGESIGYLAVNPKAEQAMTIAEVCPQISRTIGCNGTSTLMQLTVGRCADLTSQLEIYERNKDRLFSALTEYGFSCVEPGGSFYMFPRSLEPDDVAFCKKATELDLFLVPGLCFDRWGNRLGQGGGYYDRYLEQFPSAQVGVCRRPFYLEEIPHEETDRAMTAVVTEDGWMPIRR